MAMGMKRKPLTDFDRGFYCGMLVMGIGGSICTTLIRWAGWFA